jgi:hypothetical protein
VGQIPEDNKSNGSKPTLKGIMHENFQELKNNVSFKFNSSHQLSDILDKNCDCDR